MAEKVLSNVVEGIMNSLDGPLAAVDGLEDLRHTIFVIKPLLLRAEEQLAPNPEVDDLLGKLNDIIYEADDLLDAASTEALRHGLMTQHGWAKKVRTFSFKTNQFALGGKMSNKIKEIGQKLDAIKAAIQTSQSAEPLVRPRSNSNIRTEPSNLERFENVTIIGREDDKKAIIDLLMEKYYPEGDVPFLPVIGRSGLGKTILAQLIYHDEVITSSFDLKMWVSVGDTFDIKIIVKKLLESASRKIGEISKLDELIVEFRNAIVGRKYFLVLDDIWNEECEKWSDLQNLLICGARGSRVLITTRAKNVAKLMHCREPYHLRGLLYEASWHLFEVGLTSPARKRLENSSISEIARKIVQRCEGIPLIINMVARSFSYSENSKAEWCTFIEKLLNSSQGDILPPISQYCYNMLPSHLQYCFTYCSLFPKEYTICKAILIRLWIAQGFVKSQENLCLEDIGHEYFMDLLRDQFFHEPNFDEFGDIISCKMHDFMHELATSMAGPLITMSEKRKINEKTRHVGFMNFPPAMPSMLIRVRSIRTFICSNFSNFEGDCDCETIFSCFKLLRVLDLNYRDLTQVPSSISELKHLRYLDISNNKEIVKLPKSITSLLNLQTMRLSGCWSLKKLPRDIERLVNLRHLELDNCWELRYMPRGLGKLINLQTLTLFVVDSRSISKRCARLIEINRLNNLRGKLVVRDSHAKGVMSKHQPANLKEKLTSLYLRSCARGDLHNCDDNKSLESFQSKPNIKQLLVEEYWDLEFASWLSSFTGLVELKLLRCKKCQCLPPLSQLHSLKCLWLEMMDVMQYISECSGQNELSSSSSTPVEIFPMLETIHISNCPKLKGWWRDSSMEGGGNHDPEHHLLCCFPCLSSLYIRKCPLFISMPFSYSCPLKCLWLEEMDAIEYISECGDQNEFSSSSLTLVKVFPALETIHISNCPKLQGWSRDTSLEVGGGSHSPEHHRLHFFPRLLSLYVSKCPLFVSMPLSHSLSIKWLWLEEMDAIEYISEYGDQKELSSSSSTPVEIFPVLETIYISNCPKLIGWLRDFSMEVSGGSHSSKHNLLFFFPRLSSLHVSKCPLLTSIPLRHSCHSLFLKCLWLEKMDAIQYISENDENELDSFVFDIFPKLETIHLSNCPKLKSWWSDSSMEIDGCSLSLEHHQLPFFPCLSSLHISKCPHLISMPRFPYLEELYLEDASWKPLLQTMMTESTASSFAPLLKIKTMTLVSIMEVETLPGEWLRKFTCLWSLSVEHCDKLESLSVEHCVKLESLSVEYCDKLEYLGIKHCDKLEYLGVKHCDKLESLTMEHCDKLESLTLEHLTALDKLELSACYMLRELKIMDCENLTVIPEWIGNWHFLKMLEIVRCPKLTSLPEGMPRLEYLGIEECPTLMERCKEGVGEDWPKIRHIRSRTIR